MPQLPTTSNACKISTVEEIVKVVIATMQRAEELHLVGKEKGRG